ncbi:MAG: DivIVA domain-containing protein [Oscillospiraceae bacterium]|jgi:cell division initiation protein|nr:DivIVA domain-containing protein [Oscillospiraceae bacterium]
MMTPQEVANCTFAKSVMGGYNMASVDDFLDKLTEDYSALYKENAALKAKLKVTVDKMAEYRESEDAIRSTLLAAQKMSTAMLSDAEKQRDTLIEDGTCTAKARLAELEAQIAEEEFRLETVRAQVDEQLALERKRLELGQNVLRQFIRDVKAVCNEELAQLELLPDLPVEDPALPASAAPAAAAVPLPAEEAPQPEAHSAQEDEAVAASAEAEIVQRNLNRILSSFKKEEVLEETAAAPAEDPFAQPEEPSEDIEATRVLNLDDLQFGSNYKRER